MAAAAHEGRLEERAEAIGRRREALERKIDEEVNALFGLPPAAAEEVRALLERSAVAAGQKE